MKRIRDNITPEEFKHLMRYLEADESIRQNKKRTLEKVFTLLYTFGLRVNETKQVNQSMINELLQTGKSKIYTPKTNSEKYIYITDKQKKIIKKYFNPEKGYEIKNQSNRPFSDIGLISLVNSYLKKVFGNKNITSHSFRSSYITEGIQKGIGIKVISQIIGHKDISTTYRYQKVADTDIYQAIESIR